jgi:hypothetical protein
VIAAPRGVKVRVVVRRYARCSSPRTMQCSIRIVVAIVASSGIADASPEPAYGVQIAAADVTALVVGTSGAWLDFPAAEIAGGIYLFGGPTVHVAHGELDRAAASLGLRAGLPIAGLLAGDLLHHVIIDIDDPHPWNFDGPPSMFWVVGGIGGMLGAIAIDIKYLANEHRPPRPYVPVVTARASPQATSVAATWTF